jgi:hypothetical protein
MLRLIPLVLCWFVISAEEPLPRPVVPDPIGLGYRLALLDALREKGVKPPDDADEESLVHLWWERVDPTGLAKLRGEDELNEDPLAAQARCERLRRELVERWREYPAAEATEAELLTMLRSHRERHAAEVAADTSRMAADEQKQAGEKKTAKAGESAKTGDKGKVAAAASEGETTPLMQRWETLKQLPARWKPVWMGGAEANEDGARYRVRRKDGTLATVDEAPADDSDVTMVWMNMRRTDPELEMIVTKWQPMAWIAEDTQWIPGDAEIYRWSREEPNQHAWLTELMQHSAGTDKAWSKRWTEAFGDLSLQHARIWLGRSDANAAAEAKAKTAVKAITAEMATTLGIEDPWVITEGLLTLRDLTGSYSQWRIADEQAKGPAGATPPKGWKERVEAIMSHNEAQRKRIAAVMTVLGK